MSEIIVPQFFLNLEDGHWWEFKDTAVGAPARVECQATGSTLTLRIKIGNQLAEQVIETRDVTDEQTGQQLRQYTFIESRRVDQNQTVKWVDGLTLPSKWTVGESVSATSQPGANPATGNAVKVTATLASLGQFKRPALPLFGIEIKQTLKDTGLGNVIASAEMYFAGGRGIVYAKGQTFGTFFILEPTRWYGQP
ncbi:MAG TPA: hypothetical protein VF544_18715 [Pyrinomonadaceae bacterium]|jgi:hypothetical protein